jgi:rhodanese-related sulfurtransferase
MPVDARQWQLVDSRTTDDLRREHVIQANTIDITEIVRFVRLRQTGPGHNKDDDFLLSAWELFGRLYEEDPMKTR